MAYGSSSNACINHFQPGIGIYQQHILFDEQKIQCVCRSLWLMGKLRTTTTGCIEKPGGYYTVGAAVGFAID